MRFVPPHLLPYMGVLLPRLDGNDGEESPGSRATAGRNSDGQRGCSLAASSWLGCTGSFRTGIPVKPGQDLCIMRAWAQEAGSVPLGPRICGKAPTERLRNCGMLSAGARPHPGGGFEDATPGLQDSLRTRAGERVMSRVGQSHALAGALSLHTHTLLSISLSLPPSPHPPPLPPPPSPFISLSLSPPAPAQPTPALPRSQILGCDFDQWSILNGQLSVAGGLPGRRRSDCVRVYVG
jgi:hypothetical protein